MCGRGFLMNAMEFESLCRTHDLTYQYSDDHRVWKQGIEAYEEILQAAQLLPRHEAVRIWNEVVDEKIVPSVRQIFYWELERGNQ